MNCLGKTLSRHNRTHARTWMLPALNNTTVSRPLIRDEKEKGGYWKRNLSDDPRLPDPRLLDPRAANQAVDGLDPRFLSTLDALAQILDLDGRG